MKATSIAPLVVTLFLAGCYENDTGQTTRTVSWYLEHRAELNAALSGCRDNPGALSKTPNCVNANEARNKITVQEMKDALK